MTNLSNTDFATEPCRLRMRFWDTKESKMIYSWDLDCPDMTANGCPVEQGTRNNLSVRMIPLQSTGLCDSKNKEIYEGDILKFDDPNSSNKSCVNNGKTRDVFYSSRGGFRVRQESRDCQGLVNDYANICTVVGNIYETPELINS